MKEFADRRAYDDDCLLAFVGYGVRNGGYNYLTAVDSTVASTMFENVLPFAEIVSYFKMEPRTDRVEPGVNVFVLDCGCTWLGLKPKGYNMAIGLFNSHEWLPINSIAITRNSDENCTPFMGILCEEIMSGGQEHDVMRRTHARFSDTSINRTAGYKSSLLDTGTCFPPCESRGAGAAAQGH